MLVRRYNLRNYGLLLDALIKAGYEAVPFDVESAAGRSVFLRHDVDYSLECAVGLARVNCQRGISATFFLRPRAPLYNLYSPVGQAALKTIVEECGQMVGLHFSVDGGALSFAELEQRLQADFALLRGSCPTVRPVFSWHNPALTFEHGDAVMREDFDGFVNAYGHFAGGSFPYYADSNLRYSVDELHGIIGRGEPVFQLNLHPFQWAFDKDDMADVIAATLTQKVRESLAELGFNYVFQERWGGELPEAALQIVERALLEPSRQRDGETS